ncbi:hypothetical protein Tco_0097042 [Tanacetum coccineum]
MVPLSASSLQFKKPPRHLVQESTWSAINLLCSNHQEGWVDQMRQRGIVSASDNLWEFGTISNDESSSRSESLHKALIPLVPATKRIKISTTNMRINPTMPQKEETYQFWYTVKKIKGINSYEFDLANKKCTVDVEIFRKILGICLRVQGEDFVPPPSEEELLTFLLKLGYKGQLNKLPIMIVNYMHQPWRTLESIINKENVEYLELIWEDFAYQIDYREPKLKRIGEDFQEYGRAIPDTMLTDEIKQSETYQMFIKYSTGLIPLKRSKGKGSQGKKTAVNPKASVKVSDESDPEPAKRQTSSRTSKGLAADTMQAIKNIKKTSKRQPHTGGSSKGDGVTLEALDESIVILTTSSKGTGTKPGVLDEVKGSSEAKGDSAIDWGSKKESEYSKEENVDEKIDWVYSDEEEEKKDDAEDDRSIDLEETDDEKTYDDEFVHGDEYVHDEDDEEMKEAEVVETMKDEEITDAKKTDAEKIKVTNSDLEQVGKLLLTSSSLSVSSGFDTEINSPLDIQIQQEDKDDLDKVIPYLRKRGHEEDKDPSTGSNQGKRKKRSRNDFKPSKTSLASKETSKGDTPPKTSKTGKSASAEESVKEVTHEDPLTFDELMATPIDSPTLQRIVSSLTRLLKQIWDNPEGDLCPFDLSKPLPLKGHPGHLTVIAEYFFNNDLKYLKSTDSERKYTTSITKTKAARYELVGIEDMIPKLWSLNRFSKHEVFFHQKILSVVSVKVNKLHGYGYLEEIMGRRADRQLYKFKEVIVDLAVVLRMFTRSLVIKKRVEDVQLGVESYQKKLNITKPQKDFLGISTKELYTPSYKPPGVVYEDLSYQKRLMRADDLYKFSDLIDKKVLERWILRNLEGLVGARELEMDYKLIQRTI